MEIQNYINQMKEFHDLLLKCIKTEGDVDNLFLNLIYVLENFKIGENHEELRELIHLLLTVSNNHHRGPDFFDKIEKILLYFVPDIKQTFSNLDIFNLFKSNKRIILFLLDNKIITIDETILNHIMNTDNRFFFYPEIKPLIDNSDQKMIENKLLKSNKKIFNNFKKVRQNGENDSYMCQLIRNDLIDDFVDYIDQIKLPLTRQIIPSIFETNPFLIDKKPTLIEYAAFFGSPQIFEFLLISGVELKPSLWLYAIHGNNIKLIHLLEDNHVLPEDESYLKCIKTAIKCHHNEIAQYINDQYISINESTNDIDHDISNNEEILDFSFRYFNYSFFPSDFTNKYIIYYLCEYNYVTLVKLLLQSKELNLNSSIIFK